jgi:hypothetical protein
MPGQNPDFNFMIKVTKMNQKNLFYYIDPLDDGDINLHLLLPTRVPAKCHKDTFS